MIGSQVAQWWREPEYTESTNEKQELLCSVGRTAAFVSEVLGQVRELLQDASPQRSFDRMFTVEQPGERKGILHNAWCFSLVSGEQLDIGRVVTGLLMWCGCECLAWDQLTRPIFPPSLITVCGV